jgi:ABC-type spermidine/putrescine transport system permease subunit II
MKIGPVHIRWALAAYGVVFFCFLYVPMFVLFVLSFNDSPVVGFPIRTLTTAWYRQALADGVLIDALWNSATLGIASSVIGTALALTAVLGLRRLPRLAAFALPFVVLPIVMPAIVTGVVMLIFFGFTGVRLGLFPTTLIVHVTWVLPFAFLSLYPRLVGLDRSIEEAAMDLGALPFTVFRRVTFPLIRPAMIATALFAFTLSFDEFVRTFFVVGTQRTVPVHLWILVTEEVAPFLPAVGVIIMLLTLTTAALGFASSSINSRRNARFAMARETAS